MEFEEDRLYTQSLRCAGYIVYETGLFPVIKILDRGNTFIFNKDDETIEALKKYKKSQYNKDALMADINVYDEICKKLKRMCAELKENMGSQN